MRANSEVELAPCTLRGKVTGEWIPATAVVDDTPATMDKVVDLLRQKYGWHFKITMWTMGKHWRDARIILVITAK